MSRETQAGCLALTPYFTEFLARKLHQPLLPRLRTLSAVFFIELLDDSDSCWTLTLKNGSLSEIARGVSTANCGFKLRGETFAQIIAGKRSPRAAFFMRDVEIFGDIALGLKLATVLAEFFKLHPWSL